MRKKNNKIQQFAIIVLVILLAVVMIYSRGSRHARRAKVPSNVSILQENQKYAEKIAEKNGNIITHDMITKEILLGKMLPSEYEKLVPVPRNYASREGIFLHEDALNAFIKMRNQALKEGVELIILSGFRHFSHQKRIWENKWNGKQVLHGNIVATDILDNNDRAKEILKYSAMPGTSRHHWGTDMDLNSLNNSYFESGIGKTTYDWLKKNAGNYGFCQPYTAKGENRDRGYEEEKWHWSYLPLADKYLISYKKQISYDDIKGFDGYETAEILNVIENFVISINTECK